MCLLALLVVTSSAWAAVYQGDSFTFHQPDGSAFPVRIWGDEFSIHAESPNGWAMIEGAGGWWFYSQPAAGGGTEASALRVGAGDPAAFGLAPHLRQSAAQRAAISTARRTLLQRDAHGRPNSPQAQQVRAAARAAAPAGAFAPPSVPTTGVRNGITLMIAFPDRAMDRTFTQAQIDDFCNGANYTAFGNRGSIKAYFYDNSLTKLTYTNTVVNYYTALHDRSYYTDPLTLEDRPVELIKEALNAADAAGFDFRRTCDVNSDGIIDGVNAFYAGDITNNWAEGLWPHMSSLRTPWASNDGVVAESYQITNMGATLTIGTFCHENGHMLCDFPDIYDYDYDSTGGAGFFCLMNSGAYGRNGSNPAGTNPIRVCGYLALAAGWRNAVDLVGSPIGLRTVAAESVDIYRYRKPASLTEYFLIENRFISSPSGRDAALPGSGLAIWHCDELGDKDIQNYTKNALHLNYECALVQADDLRDFERDVNHGDAQDLWYQGNTAIGYDNRFEDGPGTDPTANDARWWSGAASNLLVTGISSPGQVMSFAFGETIISLTLAAFSVAEGNVGTTYATISAQRLGSTVGSASVTWTVADGTATLADLDHPGSSGVLTWANGVSDVLTFRVPVNGDTKNEPNEALTINLAALSPSLTMGLSSATLTIRNDDAAPPAAGSLELTSYAGSITEGSPPGSHVVHVLVQRRGGSTGAVSVPWSTIAGTATAGTDFTGSSGTLNWANNESGTKTISFPIMADSTPESDKTFRVILGTASGGAIAPTPNTATITILNDDFEVSLASSLIRVSEPIAGTANVAIPVRHLGAVHGTLSVNYSIVGNGSAIPGADFIQIPNGTLSWTSSTVTDPSIMLPVIADGETESLETFSVVLSDPVGFTLGSRSTATIEIADYAYSAAHPASPNGTAQSASSQGGACGASSTSLLLGIGLGLVGLGLFFPQRRRQPRGH